MTLITIAFFIVLVTLWLISSKNSMKSLPGPWTNIIPFVGSLHIMSSKPFLKLTEISKKLGPLYRLRIGSIDMVIITDFEGIKEAYTKEAFMGRPPYLPFELNQETIDTGAFTEMPWKEQRRFSLHLFRDLGVGKSTMEEHIKEEISELLQRILDLEERPVMPTALLSPSMSNNMVSLVFGKRFKFNDPIKKRLDHLMQGYGSLIASTYWQLFFPWLRALTIRFKIGSNGRLSEINKEIGDYCRKEIAEHEKTLDPNNVRDFVDGYLLEIEKQSNYPKKAFRREVLADLARIILGAGSRTVRATVDWMLLVCAAYPEVQKKIYSEIDRVIGQVRFPTWNDHFNMPFTEACILEIMRWKSIAPVHVMRYTLENTKLKGHFIPKNTFVLAVVWGIDHDSKLWGEDAQEYKPERFLSEDGRKVVKPEYSIPFSIGKRACPGKLLAEMEVFLYLVAILQKFQVSPSTDEKIDFEHDFGFTLIPKMHEVSFKRRL